jgi:ABC-type transport system involved in cytochrome bd biosynthesis fused ATPase/permease subunit
MENSVLVSTALLTLLLAVGLFFFIKASTKDRLEVAMLTAKEPEITLVEKLQKYFTERSYRIAAVNAETNQVTFEGFVRPSLFLALFLTALAAVGALCLSLVLAIAFPAWGKAALALALISPLAGLFYWKNAGRREQVLLKVEPLAQANALEQQLITVTAHRDELAALKSALALEPYTL